MHRLLIIVLLFCTQVLYAQRAYLFIKKNGKKLKTYIEGQYIKIKTDRTGIIEGYINRLRNNTIFINDIRLHKNEIEQIIVRDKKQFKIEADAKLLTLLTAAVALSTYGMTLNDREEFSTALTNSIVIGYSPLLISAIRKKLSFKRQAYKMGKKYRIDILDLYF
jgi:hypothetical protein